MPVISGLRLIYQTESGWCIMEEKTSPGAGKKRNVLVWAALVVALIAAFPFLFFMLCGLINGKLEWWTLSPVGEADLPVLEQEFQLKLTDDKTIVTEAFLLENHGLWGYGNQHLTVTIEGTSVEEFLTDHAEEFREIRDREPSSCRVVAKNGDILWITEEENRVILKKEEIRRATKTWFHENPAVKLEVIEPA